MNLVSFFRKAVIEKLKQLRFLCQTFSQDYLRPSNSSVAQPTPVADIVTQKAKLGMRCSSEEEDVSD